MKKREQKKEKLEQIAERQRINARMAEWWGSAKRKGRGTPLPGHFNRLPT